MNPSPLQALEDVTGWDMGWRGEEDGEGGTDEKVAWKHLHCVCACVLSLQACGQLFAIPRTVAHEAPPPMDSPGANTGLVTTHSSRRSS